MDLRKIIKSGSFDLHLHTTASDGEYPPEEVVNRAFQMGLKTIAITDHDTLNGVLPAIKQGEKLGIHIIPGIELSTTYEGITVDILGYGVKSSEQLNQLLKALRNERETRAIKIIEKFQEIGMHITIEDVMKFSKGEVLSRPHIARAIVAHGYVDEYQKVFDLYLADGKPCAVNKMIVSPGDGLKFIHDAGGKAILAHPVVLNEALISELLKLPFDGIEVWHRRHGIEEIKTFKRIAQENNLIMTGGSDFHNDSHQIGSFGYSAEHLLD
ncbi:PHP domain-containing protein [Peribacillus sp. SCS-155]|uniref:PHP domain-containing protein n=1 Tax=Peribacillus sedimenti TaxID=3115297 RepID=UPI0039062979